MTSWLALASALSIIGSGKQSILIHSTGKTFILDAGI
jgi:hypothetical protein